MHLRAGLWGGEICYWYRRACLTGKEMCYYTRGLVWQVRRCDFSSRDLVWYKRVCDRRGVVWIVSEILSNRRGDLIFTQEDLIWQEMCYLFQWSFSGRRMMCNVYPRWQERGCAIQAKELLWYASGFVMRSREHLHNCDILTKTMVWREDVIFVTHFVQHRKPEGCA